MKQFEDVLRHNHQILKRYLKIQHLRIPLKIVQGPLQGEKGVVHAKTDFEKRTITLDINDWHEAIKNHVHEFVHLAICEPLRPVNKEINALINWLNNLDKVAQRGDLEPLMRELVHSKEFIKRVRKRIQLAINVESYDIVEFLANILADELAVYPPEIIKKYNEHWCNHCFDWTMQRFLGEEKRLEQEYKLTFQVYKCEVCGEKNLKQ